MNNIGIWHVIMTAILFALLMSKMKTLIMTLMAIYLVYYGYRTDMDNFASIVIFSIGMSLLLFVLIEIIF
jgi:hypothetical protein